MMTLEAASKTAKDLETATPASPLDELVRLCPDAKIILDVGAAGGFFSGECDKAFPGATVYSFEPVEDNFKVLEFRSLRMLSPRGVCRIALGDFNGDAEINLTKNPRSNSLLGFLPDNPLPNDLGVTGTESIRVMRLDDWMSINKIAPLDVAILKMDVQGLELKVLDGCPEFIKTRPVVLMEVSFKAQYQDQPLFSEVNDYMADRGYVLHKLYHSAARPDVWGDAIYVPVPDAGPSAPVRLNIGAGPTVIEGFTPIDRKYGTEAFPLQYPDNSVEEIRASHILEHLSFAEVPAALEEWKRVLKPGGRLRIAVPDVDKISSTDNRPTNWAYLLMGGQTDSEDFHKSAFDEPRLRLYLQQAGMIDARHWESPNTDTAAHPMSLNIEAFKPQPTQPESMEIKIKAVMSIPRIGWNDSWQCISDTLNTFGIKIETFNGVFWGQCMQRSFEEAVAQGVDWILCLDYDSMFTAKHLDELMSWLGTRPDIDAICPLQMRRGNDSPILTAGGKTELELTSEPIKITTAHFGLTIIRVECLKDIPKPWFKSQPDADGGYGDDRLDDDIWFWHQWRLAGRNIYMAPNVRIGHLQLMVSEFDENAQPRHVHIGDWRKANSKTQR